MRRRSLNTEHHQRTPNISPPNPHHTTNINLIWPNQIWLRSGCTCLVTAYLWGLALLLSPGFGAYLLRALSQFLSLSWCNNWMQLVCGCCCCILTVCIPADWLTDPPWINHWNNCKRFLVFWHSSGSLITSFEKRHHDLKTNLPHEEFVGDKFDKWELLRGGSKNKRAPAGFVVFRRFSNITLNITYIDQIYVQI